MIIVLHISDLHFSNNAPAYNTKEILLREATEKVRNVPRGQKLIIVTGDFHNYGDSDYAKAEAFLAELAGAMDIDMSEDVFVVPGNHDVGNDDALEHLPEMKDTIWRYNKENAVNMLKGGDMKYISERIFAFRPYSNFVRKLKIYGTEENPDGPAKTYLRSWRHKLNILHLNTALIADGNTKENLITDTDTASKSETWKGYFNERIPAIAIAHNSFYDLNPRCRKELAMAFSLWNVSAYLSGDRHQIERDPEKQKIHYGRAIGQEIYNLVAAKAIADREDNYSEVGFCWHEWDESTGRVNVEFRKWVPTNLAQTESDGNPVTYTMRVAQNPNHIPDAKSIKDSFFVDPDFEEYMNKKMDDYERRNIAIQTPQLLSLALKYPNNIALDILNSFGDKYGDQLLRFLDSIDQYYIMEGRTYQHVQREAFHSLIRISLRADEDLMKYNDCISPCIFCYFILQFSDGMTAMKIKEDLGDRFISAADCMKKEKIPSIPAKMKRERSFPIEMMKHSSNGQKTN